MKRKRGSIPNLGYSVSHKPGTLATLRLKKGTQDSDLAEIVQQPDILDIPYVERGTSFLKRTCIGLGLSHSGSRGVLLNRLEMHNQGKTVVTVADETPNICETLSQLSVSAIQAPIWARGEMGLLGLPHEVVKTILHKLHDADLWSMLYVCRYTCRDVFAVLKVRAQQVFGPNGSPLALSVYKVYMDRFGNNNYYRLTNQLRRAGFYYDPDKTAKCGDNHAILCKYIGDSIDKYGSIEGVVANNGRLRATKKIKVDERKSLLIGARDRFEECVELCKRLDMPFYTGYNSITGKPNKNIYLEWYFRILNQGVGCGRYLEAFIRLDTPRLPKLEAKLVAIQEADPVKAKYVIALLRHITRWPELRPESGWHDTAGRLTSELLKFLTALSTTELRIEVVHFKALFDALRHLYAGNVQTGVIILDQQNAPVAIQLYQYVTLDRPLIDHGLNVPGKKICMVPGQNWRTTARIFEYDNNKDDPRNQNLSFLGGSAWLLCLKALD